MGAGEAVLPTQRRQRKAVVLPSFWVVLLGLFLIWVVLCGASSVGRVSTSPLPSIVVHSPIPLVGDLFSFFIFSFYFFHFDVGWFCDPFFFGLDQC